MNDSILIGTDCLRVFGKRSEPDTWNCQCAGCVTGLCFRPLPIHVRCHMAFTNRLQNK